MRGSAPRTMPRSPRNPVNAAEYRRLGRTLTMTLSDARTFVRIDVRNTAPIGGEFRRSHAT